MIDREKVIRHIVAEISIARTCKKDFASVDIDMLYDALAMLKEQETTMVIESENMYTGSPITHCPKCGKSLDRYLYGRQHE